MSRRITATEWTSDLTKSEIRVYNHVADYVGKKTGRKFTGFHYWNWQGECGVSDIRAFNAFDNAVNRIMGGELADVSEQLARKCALLSAIVHNGKGIRDSMTQSLFHEWKNR